MRAGHPGGDPLATVLAQATGVLCSFSVDLPSESALLASELAHVGVAFAE